MSEPGDSPRSSAGAMLRAAREKQGLHIAALAAAIKVTPRKLDALENDRFDELPDLTFTRALAQTVCRSLKIDPQPVLALLPHVDPGALDHVAGTLNAPFRDRPSRDAPGGFSAAAVRPMAWAGAALLLAAVVVYLLPADLWQGGEAVETRPPAASAASPSMAPASAPVAEAAVAEAPETPASAAVLAPTPSVAPAASTVAAAAPAALVQLRVSEASWVEVRDARGEVLLSRTLVLGESVGVDGALPLRLTIGNAQATKLSFRGKPVDLAPSMRDNVARLELQ